MVTKWRIFHGAGSAALIIGAALAFGGAARSEVPTESSYYPMFTFKLPETGTAIEPGAIERMPDGRIAVSTRMGEIWMIEKAYGRPPTEAKFKLFASGLHEVLGLAYRDGWLYCTQRGEVTRGAHRAAPGDAGVDAAVEHLDEELDYLLAHAAVAETQGLRPQKHHRPHHRDGQVRPDAHGVGTDQVLL